MASSVKQRHVSSGEALNMVEKQFLFSFSYLACLIKLSEPWEYILFEESLSPLVPVGSKQCNRQWCPDRNHMTANLVPLLFWGPWKTELHVDRNSHFAAGNLSGASDRQIKQVGKL